jgi:hypothetical protein
VAEHIDKEIGAIKAVLRALEPLSAEIRASVLSYVTRRLQITLAPVQHDGTAATAVSSGGRTIGVPDTNPQQQTLPSHIKDLKEKKKPRSANEMAALVAYYLANVPQQKDRKDKITTKDIETYFKIAEFPLPEKTQFTLPNAKAAGYLDAVGNGEYKLNAVGHNLVVHSMPRGADGKGAARRRATTKAKRATQKRK